MRRGFIALSSALAAVTFVLLSPNVSTADAAVGDVLAEIETGSVGPATVAFDGRHVYFTDAQGLVLSRVNQSGGERVDVPIVGAVGVNAIAYDASRDTFWAVDGTGLGVYLLGRDGIATLQFVINPLTDLPGGCGTLTGCSTRVTGFAYDATDDTVWYAPDGSARVYQLTSVGQPLAYFDLVASPGCTPATGGVAAGAASLYVADKGCGRVVQYDKVGGVLGSFGAAGVAGDVSCDDLSFSRSAAWVRDQADGRIRAYEIRQGTCIYGGGVDFRPIPAWMTGGGTTPSKETQATSVDVAHIGLRLNCPAAGGLPEPNRLTIVWEKDNDLDGNADERHRFHLAQVLTQSCSNSPFVEPTPPSADFDTMNGSGLGRYDSERCNGSTATCAEAHWEFIDAGEPPFFDGVRLQVFAPGGLQVLAIQCAIDGNLQAHGTSAAGAGAAKMPDCTLTH